MQFRHRRVRVDQGKGCERLLWLLYRTLHDDVIKWIHFRITGPLCGEFWRHCNDLTHSVIVTIKCVHQMGPYLNKCWLIINKNQHKVIFLTKSPYNSCDFILSSLRHVGGNWPLLDKMATQITDDNLTCHFASFFRYHFIHNGKYAIYIGPIIRRFAIFNISSLDENIAISRP